MFSQRACAVACLALGLLSAALLLPARLASAGILDASWIAPTTNIDGSPLTDLASYRVYYGTSNSPCPASSSFSVASATASPPSNQAVSLRLTGLAPGTQYFVSVSAVDANGNQSACSSAASAVARSDFAVSPTGSVNFGNVSLGSFVEQTYTVSNVAGGTVSGSASVPLPFTIVSGSPFSITGAGATQPVKVRFTPATTTTVSATISFTANSGTIAGIVTGLGVATTADTTKPTIAVTSPTSGPAYTTASSSLTLQGTASDNVGVTQVTWTNSRGGSGTATGSTSWTASGVALQSGSNVLTVTARDAAGNTGTASITATYDNTPPSVSITAPAVGATVVGTVNVTANASDNVSVAGVQFLLDGVALGAEQTSGPFSLAWTSGSAADGAHTLSARARDAVGNKTVAANVAVTVSNAPSSPPPPSPSGLVAAYSFREGAGTVVTDASGNGNTGSLGSGVTWTAAGRFGSALAFNGASFVTIPAAASLNITTAMTLEAWVYPTGKLYRWNAVLVKEQPGEFLYALYSGSSSHRRPYVYFNTSSTSAGEHGASGTKWLPFNAWSHLAGTYDGASLKLYVNGQLVRSQAVSGPMATSTGPLRIGGNSIWNQYFQGRIDEVRIYNRARSQSEIQVDMNTAVGGP